MPNNCDKTRRIIRLKERKAAVPLPESLGEDAGPSKAKVVCLSIPALVTCGGLQFPTCQLGAAWNGGGGRGWEWSRQDGLSVNALAGSLSSQHPMLFAPGSLLKADLSISPSPPPMANTL